jgi:hypothetical protein
VKTYEGKRQGHTVVVTVNGATLNPRLDLWSHSPTGFEWGYGGSGPAQLALALLADCLDNDDEAIRLHQEFKWKVVANLDARRWLMTSQEILATLEQITQPERSS